jgi:hypothetical protein
VTVSLLWDKPSYLLLTRYNQSDRTSRIVQHPSEVNLNDYVQYTMRGTCIGNLDAFNDEINEWVFDNTTSDVLTGSWSIDVMARRYERSFWFASETEATLFKLTF